MAYSTSNPPRLLVAGVGGGASLWLYDDEDTQATVNTADYFSNADELGMKVGDVVIGVDSAGSAVGYITQVNSVTAGGAGDVADGTAIDMTDTD